MLMKRVVVAVAVVVVFRIAKCRCVCVIVPQARQVTGRDKAVARERVAERKSLMLAVVLLIVTLL